MWDNHALWLFCVMSQVTRSLQKFNNTNCGDSIMPIKVINLNHTGITVSGFLFSIESVDRYFVFLNFWLVHGNNMYIV